ncbi:hypothetical protein S40288_10615 [Stachybotrys chartarum IBT 40288]|nr:hypothetical protein S40288_10615 [Stachybotrys chartarum IBT 40288]
MSFPGSRLPYRTPHRLRRRLPVGSASLRCRLGLDRTRIPCHVTGQHARPLSCTNEGGACEVAPPQAHAAKGRLAAAAAVAAGDGLCDVFS